MSERGLAIPGSLAPLARRLGERRIIALLVAGGIAVAAIVTLWLTPSPPSPDNAAVEVPLPPPAAQAPKDTPASAPSADPKPQNADPAAEIRPGAGNAVTVPPVAVSAFAHVPLAPRVAPLPPAPEAALVETAAEGPLPRRSADGRLPWQAYARPFPASDSRARMAVIVAGLGPSAIVTREIIRRLPADVTLAFEPASPEAAQWAREARAAGHEIMLSLPVQGGAFPFLDRGPEALAGDLAAAENRARLRRMLGRLTGYVGVLTNVGAESDASDDALATAALELAGAEFTERGLMLAGPLAGQSAGGGVPRLSVDLSIGPDADAAAVRARLAELEAGAAAQGHAVAVVEPTPAAAEALVAWIATLEGKPAVLAPVSAVAQAVQARAN